MKGEMKFGERLALSRRLADLKVSAAGAVTDEFFRRHPDWLERYGERGRLRGIEDAGYHVEFLSNAITSGDEAAFEGYARWAAGMLSARGIAPEFLAENFRQIADVLAPSLTPEQAAVVNAYVGAGCAACLAPVPPKDEAAGAGGGRAAERRLYLEAALRGNRGAATGVVMEALRGGADVVELYVEIFQATQYELGRLWESNKISVAEEHMATAVTQYVMAQVYPLIKIPGEVRGRMIITGIEGEMHQVGANMVADVLDAHGWDVCFLGTNMPHEGILRAVEEHRPRVVGVSATMLFSLPKVIRLVEQLRNIPDPGRPQIIVGGTAFRATPGLYAEIGADGFAPDLKTAIALTCGRME